ncbi:MAG: CPBP family intramembrane metalloprotease [Clostridia bacterium]|nr:CPBP family intramembrane metalloprotease [Clostridia bacterium]
MSKIKDYHITPVFALIVYILLFAASFIKLDSGFSVNTFLIVFVTQILVFVLPSIIYKRIKGPIKYRESGFRFFGASSILFVICASVFMFCASVLIGVKTSGASGAYYADLSEITVPGILYIIVIYCLLPAITEEIAFRSVIYGEYRKFGVFGAVVLSSALFSLVHFSLTSFLSYFMCGAVLALVYEVTKSVFASMLSHFLYNLMSVFSQKILSDAANKADNMIPFVFAFVCAMLLFLFFALSRAQKILEYDAAKLPEKENEEFPPLNVRLRSLLISLVSPGFLLCLGFAVFAGIMRAGR